MRIGRLLIRPGRLRKTKRLTARDGCRYRLAMPATFSGPDEDRVSHRVTLLAIVDFLRCSAEVFVPFRDFNAESAPSWYHYIHEKQRVTEPLKKVEQPANENLVQRDQKADPPEIGAALIVEMDRVLKHKIFRRSPTLCELLKWLLNETLAARGDLVRSYTISLFHVGRFDNADSPVKSYSGVQIGRLRKVLEIYYSQVGNVHNGALYILPGTHGVRFGSIERDYPSLHDVHVEAHKTPDVS